MKEKIAKIIRIITVPPLLVVALIITLYLQNPSIFRDGTDYAVALVFLGLFPVLVYPIWAAVPKLKEKGREGQRNLAFIGTLIGYTFAFLYGELSGAVPELKLIFRTYFIAVLLLTFANKVLKKRASGHACSVVSSALFLCCFVEYRLYIIVHQCLSDVIYFLRRFCICGIGLLKQDGCTVCLLWELS